MLGMNVGRKSEGEKPKKKVLSRFAKYLERTWDFEELLSHVHDGRLEPQIPVRAVWLSEFGMHAMRLGSHNALGQELKIPARWDPWVGALDGQEPYCSFKRRCPGCMRRDIKVEGGIKTQYYHRYVVLQLVGVTPVLELDIEPLLPGDTEASAGLRLLKRFTKRCWPIL